MVVTNQGLYHHVLEKSSISHLSFSDKKYSAIHMWESICSEVKQDYPQYFRLAKQDLMCAAVYGMYEARACKYDNKVHIKHMRQIARKNILHFCAPCLKDRRQKNLLHSHTLQGFCQLRNMEQSQH